MTGELDTGTADVIVYVDHSHIHEGRLAELKDGIRRVVDAINELEPQLITYGFHIDEARSHMTVTAVHPDSASLELHMEVGRELFRSLSEMITLEGIEVYGTISDRVRELLQRKVAMLGAGEVVVTERFAGFARSTATR